MIKNAPNKGYLLTYGDNKVELYPYDLTKDKINFKEQTYHLFDEQKEYRRFYSNGKLHEIIISSDEEKAMDKDLLYAEEIELEDIYKSNTYNKIKIVNRYKYKNNNSLCLVNYRLAGLIWNTL